MAFAHRALFDGGKLDNKKATAGEPTVALVHRTMALHSRTLPVLFLMAILAKSLLSLMRGDLMALSLTTTRHRHYLQ